jgi:alpha-D-ribose 1-methylphosphonate 5-triphosphate synthase subunit PhnH
MMTPSLVDLSSIGRGFEDLALDSQAVFRQVLSAISKPGEIHVSNTGIESPEGLHPAAAAVLLALLDQDTRLWLSPAFGAGVAGAYLRFHTGCILTDNPLAADFVLARPDELPKLSELSLGSEEYPERSATVVVQVDDLSNDGGWHLSGPGIDGHAVLQVAGLEASFLPDWRESQLQFPRGIDLIFTSADRLAAMPRTTRAEA